MQKNGGEGRWLFASAALLCAVAVACVFGFLIARSIPFFQRVSPAEFLLGQDWFPDRADTYTASVSGSYGILPMLVGTLAATAGALVIGGGLGFFTAVFLAFYCPKALRGALLSTIHLLAGIPSVVYGFFGISFLLPTLSPLAHNNGSGLLAVSLILGIMLLPTVVSVAANAMQSVPTAYYQGALALGATHSEAVFRVMLPAARSGIAASLVLGAGRALGETMAVMMVAGNAPTYPTGLFGSFRTLTASIAMEMGYAGELQEGALIASGAALLLLILCIHLLFGALVDKRKKKEKRGHETESPSPAVLPFVGLRVRLGNIAYRVGAPAWGRPAAWISAGITVGALLLVMGFLFLRGLPVLWRDPALLWRPYVFGGEQITLLPALVTTLYTVGISLLFALPIGIMTAVYLHEYASSEKLALRLIRRAIDLLSGVPSIVYGLFGMVTFVRLLGGSGSILAGSMTVSLMLLPVVVRGVEESLRGVPAAYREGSYALGAGKLRTVARIVLPAAFSGILSTAILSMGRVIGESAPFLYTAGSVIARTPRSPLDGGATLSVALYQLSGEGWYTEEAYAAAVVLMGLVLILNPTAQFLGKRLRSRGRGDAS